LALDVERAEAGDHDRAGVCLDHPHGTVRRANREDRLCGVRHRDDKFFQLLEYQAGCRTRSLAPRRPGEAFENPNDIIERPNHVEYTWVSEATKGLESIVAVTFEARGDRTEVTLRHSGIPDDEMGRQHKEGWTWVLSMLAERFASQPSTPVHS